jgi:hypothetical protein
MIKVANNLLKLSQHMLKRSYDPRPSLLPWRYPQQQPQMRYDYSGGTGFHAEGKPAVSMAPEKFERYQARMLLNPYKMPGLEAFPDAETAAAYYNTATGGDIASFAQSLPKRFVKNPEAWANMFNKKPPVQFGSSFPGVSEEFLKETPDIDVVNPFNPNQPYFGKRWYLQDDEALWNRAAYRQTPKNPTGDIFHYTEGPDGKPVFSNPEYLKSLAAEGNRLIKQEAPKNPLQ